MGQHPTDTDLAGALAQVDRDYPGWHALAGRPGRPGLRAPAPDQPAPGRAATSVNQLRTEIEAAEAERGLR
jgi:hypothetical protein